MSRWNDFLEKLGLWEQQGKQEQQGKGVSSEAKLVTIQPRQKIKIIVSRPLTAAEGLDLARNLRRKHILIINIDLLNEMEATKIINYLSGAATALDGKSQSLGGKLYMLTSGNVNVETAFQEEFGSLRGNSSGKEGQKL